MIKAAVDISFGRLDPELHSGLPFSATQEISVGPSFIMLSDMYSINLSLSVASKQWTYCTLTNNYIAGFKAYDCSFNAPYLNNFKDVCFDIPLDPK